MDSGVLGEASNVSGTGVVGNGGRNGDGEHGNGGGFGKCLSGTGGANYQSGDPLIQPGDIGGIHIKYLHYCARQLWLYARGVRAEQLSDRVQFGEATRHLLLPQQADRSRRRPPRFTSMGPPGCTRSSHQQPPPRPTKRRPCTTATDIL
jgi:hypothetical protein